MTWLAYSHLGVPKTVTLTTQPGGAVAGAPFTTQPAGKLVDGGGSLARVTGTDVTVLKFSGTGTLGGTLTQATAEGLFAFTDLQLSLVTSTVTLRFDSTGLTSATSSSFNVTGLNNYSLTANAGAYALTGSTVNLSYTQNDQGTLLFSEGFESGTISSNGWFDDGSVPVVADARPGSSGSNALSLVWNEGATVATGVGAARIDFEASESVYFSYWIKHSASWVGSGQTYHPHMFHFLTDVDDHYIGPSVTHLTTYDELSYQSGQGGMVYRMALQDSLNIDTGNLLVDLTAITEDRSVCGANGQPESGFVWDVYDNGGGDWRNYKTLDTASQVITDATKEDWHHIETYWKMNSIVGSVGQPNGVMRMWIDDELQIDRNDVYFRTNKNPTMEFRTFVIAPYIQDGAPVSQYMRIDDLEIWTAPPPGSDYSLSCSPGAYTLTGAATSLLFEGNAILIPSAGSYAVNGQAAALVYTPLASTHEPSGYTQVTSQPFSSLPSNGWYVDIGTMGSNMNLITDASAPESPSGILRFTYPTGYAAGSAPGKIEYPPINSTTIYYRIVFRHSANFYGNSSQTNKMAFADMHNSGTFFFNARGSGSGDLLAVLHFQNVPADEIICTPNLSAGILTRGVWHTFEALLESGAAGTATSRARGWLDGVATHDYQNLTLSAGGQSNDWDYASIYPIWGGTSGTVPSTQTWDIDHVYISKP